MSVSDQGAAAVQRGAPAVSDLQSGVQGESCGGGGARAGGKGMGRGWMGAGGWGWGRECAARAV